MPLARDHRLGGNMPRVLLVDDHQGMLDRVSAILADSFDVVGAVTSGRQALELARALDPDAIVLDINMPGFDGFETMAALTRAGSRAAVIFLSLLADDDHINAAFRLGGRGYVLKLRMLNDLPAALDHVLLGRRFAPSLTPLRPLNGAGGHAMHLHANEASFADAIVSSFHAALGRGEPTCLIATASLRDRVITQLQTRGWSVGQSDGEKRFSVFDTHAALADVVIDGLPDPARVAAIIDELDNYRRTVALGPASLPLTIAGDLSGTLHATGNAAGAIAIERLWNTHTEGRPFFTVCGYALSCFQEHARDAWPATAAEHSAVCHAADI